MLTATYTLPDGAAYSEAVALIRGFRLLDDPNADIARAGYVVVIHRNVAAMNSGERPLLKEERYFELDQKATTSPTRQAYDHLKTDTRFTDIVEGGWLTS